jgi:hypothetical protein
MAPLVKQDVSQKDLLEEDLSSLIGTLMTWMLQDFHR